MLSIVSVICVVEFEAELLKLLVDRLGRAAVLVDVDDATLEVDARFDRPKNLVAGSEDAREKPELLVEQLKDTQVGGVGLVEEVDNDDVVLLSVAMAPPDPLLYTLRVPRQVVVHDH